MSPSSKLEVLNEPSGRELAEDPPARTSTGFRPLAPRQVGGSLGGGDFAG